MHTFEETLDTKFHMDTFGGSIAKYLPQTVRCIYPTVILRMGVGDHKQFPCESQSLFNAAGLC